MKKVLLLNPSGNKKYLRDYYCSDISKGRYYWPPLDLLILSGLLNKYCKVSVIDAIAQGMHLNTAYRYINGLKPDFIVSLAGTASWHNDMYFLSKLKKISTASIILSGDYPLARPEKVIKKYPFIDAILLDFTENNIIDYLYGNKNSSLTNIITRFDLNKPKITSSKTFSIPIPRHELFPLKRYHLPHIGIHPFATIMTEFGCLFNCAFCPYERIGYKKRDIDNVIEEIKYVQSLGIKELWLRNLSFGSSRKHAEDFCKALKNINGRFSWSCEMRVDAADEDLLSLMKEAGCHTVMFGVESSNQSILDIYKKGISLDQIRRAFKIAKKSKLKTLAHFILGLPGEDMQSQNELIKFCLSLNPDYASFNIATPLLNTSFQEESAKNKNTRQADMNKIRNVAMRKFYLRPSYILYRIKNIKTLYQFFNIATEGVRLFYKSTIIPILK